MAQIYASSFAMVIWLGEPAPDSVVSAKDSRLWLLALKRLEEYQAAEHSTAIDTPPAWIERQRDDERWERIREATLGIIQKQTTDEERSFVTKLMGLPWFTRRWVVQECIMSTTRYVLYGQHIVGAGAFDGSSAKAALSLAFFSSLTSSFAQTTGIESTRLARSRKTFALSWTTGFLWTPYTRLSPKHTYKEARWQTYSQ
ncbi:hypothetical protein B0A55_12408 [Friedmanniomyces simplex]|uniref:Heterokaryon incompatibility domain-containing protein n=1 Tax=Friedmanniomyces simplex TaxID=329884 RepID=A0A4U0W8Z9_9PEZI|nr:hypothetical protein B0A55_12408 [Friedmanniomyces simplex]